MRIISFNVNGLRAALGKGLTDFLQQHQPDIVCLQELKNHEPALPESSAYRAYWHPAERKGYSGVAILSRQPAQQVTYGLGVADFDCEGRVLRVDYQHFSVLSVYVPSGSSQPQRQDFKMDFLAALSLHLDKLLKEQRPVIVCGDFNIAHQNIDLTNWKQNQKNSGFLPEERAWLDALLANGWIDAYRQAVGPEQAAYSWWSLRSGARARNVGWRLDYQFCSAELRNSILKANIPPQPIMSDHAPVILDYDLGL